MFYDVREDSIFERDMELKLEQVVEAPLATPDDNVDDDIIVVYTCRRYIHLLNIKTQTDMVYDHLLDRCRITYRTQTYIERCAREAPVGGAQPFLERRRSLWPDSGVVRFLDGLVVGVGRDPSEEEEHWEAEITKRRTYIEHV